MATELLEETKKDAERKDPAPVTLRSIHDYTLTTTALEHRAEELKKLAKRNKDEGYIREARAIDADAASIDTQILPCFRQQRELPLVSHEKLQEEIEGAIRRTLRLPFAGLGANNLPITAEAVEARLVKAHKALAERISLFAIDLADEAFNQGFAAREQESRAIAMRVVGTLRPNDT